ncbi:MAG: non-homologous end-joining DNA ligase [Candidatus Doudnabacteria bacterium]
MKIKHIKPMLATLVDTPFDAEGWLFEIKWDGFRAIAQIENDKVELYSRNFLSFNNRFAPIVKTLQGHKLNAVLDGEIVVMNSAGKSEFQMLQNQNQTGKGILIYCVFDILFLKGKDLRHLTLLERKKILKKILPKNNQIKYSDHVLKEGLRLFKTARKRNLEGIMAKDIHSPYRSGMRTKEWQKIKIRMRQEAIICGFTAPRGRRIRIGALVLGVFKQGKLTYIGHAGTGFDEKTLNLVYNKLKPLEIKKSPFRNPPDNNTAVTWVRPKFVCEVGFEEWTEDGHMRQPSFLGLRPDKKASEVRREIPK